MVQALVGTALVGGTYRLGHIYAYHMGTVMFVYARACQHQIDVRHDRRFLMLSLRSAILAVMVSVVMEILAHCAVQVQFRVFLYQAVVFAELARTGQLQAAVRPAPHIRSRPQAARTSRRVPATPGGQELAVPALPVCLANTSPSMGLLHALIVHPTPSLQIEASQIQHVHVTMGIREKMEAHVPSATQALIKMDLDCIVKAVPLIHFRHLAATQTRRVTVTLGMQEKMEAPVYCVTLTLIKKAWALQIALIVHQTPTLQLVVSHTPHVNVTLGTVENMEERALCCV